MFQQTNSICKPGQNHTTRLFLNGNIKGQEKQGKLNRQKYSNPVKSN